MRPPTAEGPARLSPNRAATAGLPHQGALDVVDDNDEATVGSERGEHRIAAGLPATQEHTGEQLCVGLQGQHADACTATANARLTHFVDNSD
ncbi:hypothetical protein GCM10009646_40300 [Streptomyces aureus]